MTFQPGVSGNPKGGQINGKPIRDALNLAVKDRTPDGRRNIRAMADTIVQMAIDGDVAAFREISNRLEGLPKQSVEVDTGDRLSSLLAQISGSTRGLPSQVIDHDDDTAGNDSE